MSYPSHEPPWNSNCLHIFPSNCQLLEIFFLVFHDTINLPCSVKLISFFIGTCWYFKALFTLIKMYWGLGGNWNLRIISDPCLTAILGLCEWLWSFDTTTILIDFNLFESSDSSKGSLQDRIMVWLLITVKKIEF